MPDNKSVAPNYDEVGSAQPQPKSQSELGCIQVDDLLLIYPKPGYLSPTLTYRVVGIYLGGERTTSLVELQSLNERNHHGPILVPYQLLLGGEHILTRPVDPTPRR